MYYFIELKTIPGIITTQDYDVAAAHRAAGCQVRNRNDLETYAEAEKIAAVLNTQANAEQWIATDEGSNVSPRYDVVRLPQVGDAVSFEFNGDAYPDGFIESVGTGVKRVVRTSTGSTYYRRKLTGGWQKEGGTWWMVKGHVSKRNPSF